MSKQNLDLGKGLSIEELENRHELTVVLSTANLEAGGRQTDDCIHCDDTNPGWEDDPGKCDNNDGF